MSQLALLRSMVADITLYICQLPVTGSKRDGVKVWTNQFKSIPTPRKMMPWNICFVAGIFLYEKTSIICRKRKVTLFHPLILEGTKDAVHLATALKENMMVYQCWISFLQRSQST